MEQSIHVALALAILCSGSLSASTISIVTNVNNAQFTPTGYSIVPLTGTPVASAPVLNARVGAKVRNSPTNFDQTIDDGAGTTLNGSNPTFMQANRANVSGKTWQFQLSHYAGQGFVFTLTNASNASDTYTLAWGSGFLAGILPGSNVTTSALLDTLPPDYSSYNSLHFESRAGNSTSNNAVTLSGAAFALCPFTTATSLSAACATPPTPTVNGAFESSPVTLLSPSQNSSSSGYYHDWVVTDMNLALYDWKALATVTLTGGKDEATKFTVSAKDLAAATPTPEPATLVPALMALAALAHRIRCAKGLQRA